MPGPVAHRRAPSMREARSAVPRPLLRGFCGETSQITRSSPSRTKAVCATWAWPSCAGLNDPPRRPTRMPGRRSKPGLSARRPPASRARLTGPVNHILEDRELFGADGAPGMQLVGGDADLGAETELAAVGKLRRGVDHHNGGIDAGGEGVLNGPVLGHDGVGVAGAVF